MAEGTRLAVERSRRRCCRRRRAVTPAVGARLDEPNRSTDPPHRRHRVVPSNGDSNPPFGGFSRLRDLDRRVSLKPSLRFRRRAKHILKAANDVINMSIPTPTPLLDDVESHSSSRQLRFRKDPSSRRCWTCFHWTAAFFGVLFFIVFGIVPFVFRFSSDFRHFFVFMNGMKLPVKTPQKHGLFCTAEFKINGMSVWHVRPFHERYRSNCTLGPNGTATSQQWFLKDDAPVIVYAHGIIGSRDLAHRVRLYKALSQKMGAHVITFDYHGYADSEYISPSKEGMVRDTLDILKYVSDSGVSPRRMIAFGHSMGTAVMTYAMASLKNRTRETLPRSVVLESPFISMEIVTYDHPPSKVFSFLPWFKFCFVDSIVGDPDTNFEPIKFVGDIPVPILVLHARNDIHIPFYHGVTIYEAAKRGQRPDVAAKTSSRWFDDGRHDGLVDQPHFIDVIRRHFDSL